MEWKPVHVIFSTMKISTDPRCPRGLSDQLMVIVNNDVLQKHSNQSSQSPVLFSSASARTCASSSCKLFSQSLQEQRHKNNNVLIMSWIPFRSASTEVVGSSLAKMETVIWILVLEAKVVSGGRERHSVGHISTAG